MNRTPALALLALSTTALSRPAHAVAVDVQLTVDNAYAIYTGTSTTVTDFHGMAENTLAQEIRQPESYSFDMNEGDIIYVVAWSDDGVHQGLLAEFDIDGTVVTTANTQWEVMATGIDLDVGDAPPSLPDLTTQIQLANAGSVPSGGWVAPEFGDYNDGSAIVDVPLMASNIQWAWYRSASTPSSATAFRPGANHDEFLVFRMIFPLNGCCVADECLNTTPEDCVDRRGEVLPTGMLCEDLLGECLDAVESTGACCVDDTCEELTRRECVEQGGEYLGDDTDCESSGAECEPDVIEEKGACCVGEECLELDAMGCVERGGEFLGAGSSCEDTTLECPPVDDQGACCVDGACLDANVDKCRELGGTFLGAGSECGDVWEECATSGGDDTAAPVGDGTTDPEVAVDGLSGNYKGGCSVAGGVGGSLATVLMALLPALMVRRRDD